MFNQEQIFGTTCYDLEQALILSLFRCHVFHYKNKISPLDTSAGFLSGYPIPRKNLGKKSRNYEKSRIPGIKNLKLKKSRIPGIKNPRFTKIPSPRDKNPKVQKIPRLKKVPNGHGIHGIFDLAQIKNPEKSHPEANSD